VAVIGWIGVIFFSSTSTASLWCETAFSYLARFFIAGIPRDSGSFGIIHLVADKGLHVTLFTVLAILLTLAMASGRRKVVRILAFGFLVGCCSEYLQSFFPDRDPAIRDVLINLAGTGFGALIGRLLSLDRATEAQDAQRLTFSHSDGSAE
jgi:VanZ family protein